MKADSKKSNLIAGLMPAVLLLAGIFCWLPGTLVGAENPPGSPNRPSREIFIAELEPFEAMPIRVVSRTEKGTREAEISATLDQDFSSLTEALSMPANWCEIVPVVLNIKACTWRKGRDGPRLTFYVGRKFYEPPENAHELQYDFSLKELRDDYLHVVLQAEKGPFGTRDYLLEVKAVRLQEKTHLSVLTSMHSSTFSRLATRGYLATLGRDKVGFTIVGGTAENPEYIRGVRGIVERNAVRYYLALKAYLETRHLPPDKRYAAAAELWYDLTEQYHEQLYEMDKEEYLETKQKERRQQLRLEQGIRGKEK